MAIVLRITPTSFIASGGKLNSDLNYLFSSPVGGFHLTHGRIVDFGFGTVRIAYGGQVTDYGGYAGSFVEQPSVRLTINGA